MNKIESALQRTTDTRFLLFENGAVHKVGEAFSQVFGGRKAVVVSDTNIWNVAACHVQASLERCGVETCEPIIFSDPHFYAEWKFVEQLQGQLSQIDAIAVAVGSGVINDLCKYVSHILGRHYMCVGTAASMDGFTAYGASITKDGNKQTFSCPAPYAFVMDPQIAANAPKDLAASGYADLIAKVPAGADWMLAECVGSEAVDPFAFSLVQDGLKEALDSPAAVHSGDVEKTSQLCEGLLMSGFAMQAMHSSRPASGTEHQFSHCWDMENLSYPDGTHVSHGFKVGIGTLVSTAVWEYLMDRDMLDIDVEACVSSWKSWEEMEREIRHVFEGKPGHLSRALEETKGKYSDKDNLRSQLNAFLCAWPSLKEEIRKKIFTFEQVYGNLKAVGAPYEPEMICVSRQRLKDTFAMIPYMRNRFTVMDLVYRLGLMDEVSEALFGKKGKWEI